MKWYCVSNPPGYNKPEWVRSALLHDNGQVFIPAVIAGNEKDILLRASFDNIGIVYDDGHLYVPSDWVANEYPDVADICEKIKNRVCEAGEFNNA